MPSDSPIRPSSGALPASFVHQLEAARRNPNLNLGKLTLLEELGHGGMGVVYRAWQNDLQRMVAVKVLPANSPREAAERFLREARLASKLRHPNIVAVHEMGEHKGRPWFSMDLVEGGSLDPLVRGRRLPPAKLMEILRDVARALQFAHESGVVHRDIKPANVLMDAEGRPHLTDFGLAADLEGTQGRLTLSGAIMGTPAYMSPEQARGRRGKPDARTDIYSLGAVMYEGLAGRPVVEATDLVGMVSAVLHSSPDRPGAVAPGVPRAAETICLKCLEKDPARRYATAAALADDIDRFLRGESILARPPGLLERVARRPVALGAAAAVLLAAAAAGWLVKREIRRGREAEERQRVIAELRARLETATSPEEIARLKAELAAKTGGAAEAPKPVEKPVEKPPEPGPVSPPTEPRTERLARDVRARLDAGEFGAAMKIVDDFLPVDARETEWRDGQRTLVDGTAQAAFDEIDKRAQGLLLAGSFDLACGTWDEARKIGLPRFASLAAERVAQATARRIAALRDEAQAKIGPVRDEVLKACAKRDYAAALAAIGALEKSEPLLLPDLATLRFAVESAAAAFAAAPRGADALKGAKFDSKAGPAEVAGSDGALLRVLIGRTPTSVAYADLPGALLADLAKAGGAAPGQVGAFRLFEGSPDEAMKAWAGSARQADLDALAASLKDAAFELEAGRRLAELLEAAKAQNWKQARELLALRDRYAASPAWKSAAAQLDDIAWQAALPASDEPFAFPPRKAGASLEWRYDFSKPEQMRDWRQVSENVYAANAFGFALEDGAVQLQNSNLAFAAPLEGDLRFAFDVTIRHVKKDSFFGVFLGGYVWALNVEDDTELYTPGEARLAGAPGPGVADGRAFRAEMTIGKDRVRCALDGKQVLEARVAEGLIPLPPMIFTAKDARVSIDNIELRGAAYAGWKEDALARRALLDRALRPSALGPLQLLCDGSAVGKLRRQEDGTWEATDGGLLGTSPDADTRAELHYWDDALRNYRLRFEYRPQSGARLDAGVRMKEAEATFKLPMDRPGRWRGVEIVAAEDAVRCVVDGTLEIDPDERVLVAGRGGARLALTKSAASVRNVTLEEIRGLPETRPWEFLFDGSRVGDRLRLDGVRFEKDRNAICGKGTIEIPGAGPGREWILVAEEVAGVSLRVEAGGAVLWEYHCPDRQQNVGVRWRGDAADVLWNGTVVASARRTGKSGLRFVVTDGSAKIAAVLERAR